MGRRVCRPGPKVVNERRSTSTECRVVGGRLVDQFDQVDQFNQPIGWSIDPVQAVARVPFAILSTGSLGRGRGGSAAASVEGGRAIMIWSDTEAGRPAQAGHCQSQCSTTSLSPKLSVPPHTESIAGPARHYEPEAAGAAAG
jgi:hypothetical protein